MPGLVPGIHAFPFSKDVDGRDKPGHDELKRRPKTPLAIRPDCVQGSCIADLSRTGAGG